MFELGWVGCGWVGCVGGAVEAAQGGMREGNGGMRAAKYNTNWILYLNMSEYHSGYPSLPESYTHAPSRYTRAVP